ncbi:hypothetical protein ABKP09_20085 [Peribacillus frigoritolerans]|uniref:hypothetical protein n=1 Tax=Peribacillus frigoritolerans TaxID=450367 RepID=UPI0032B5012B
MRNIMLMYLENALKNAEKNGKTPIIIDPAGERKDWKTIFESNIHIKPTENGKLQPFQIPIKHVKNTFTQDDESWAFYELNSDEMKPQN